MGSSLGVGRMSPLRWQAAAKSPGGGGSGGTLGPNPLDSNVNQEAFFLRTELPRETAAVLSALAGRRLDS